MKIILVFVTTLDGKITKGSDPHVSKWSSKEDQEYFKKTWNDAKLIVIGRTTFRAEPIKPSKKHLLIVMTHRPGDFREYEVPGELEFTDETPEKLAARCANLGFEEMLMAGGAHAATSFLKANLIDEVWLTFEPRIFGVGSNFAIQEPLDLKLELLSSEKINAEGTMIAKYRVLK